jgi:hypothetical protein
VTRTGRAGWEAGCEWEREEWIVTRKLRQSCKSSYTSAQIILPGRSAALTRSRAQKRRGIKVGARMRLVSAS